MPLRSFFADRPFPGEEFPFPSFPIQLQVEEINNETEFLVEGIEGEFCFPTIQRFVLVWTWGRNCNPRRCIIQVTRLQLPETAN